MSSPLAHLPFAESSRHLDDLGHLDAMQRQQVRDFESKGYVVFDPGIALEILDRVVATLHDQCFDADGKVICDRNRIQDAWDRNDQVKEIACAPKVLELLRLLHGREPIPFQTLNFPVGTEQRTHSDTIHFNSVPMRFMAGVWVALEDVDADNGPLHYYEGSHKLPFFEMADVAGWKGRGFAAPAMDDYELYEDFVEAYLPGQGLVRHELDIKKGQALVWSANLFHGGSPIRDRSRTRWSQVSHYYFDDCLYYTPRLSHPAIGKYYLRNITDIRSGQQVPNRFHGNEVRVDYTRLYHFDAAGRAVPVYADRSPLFRATSAVGRFVRNLRG